MRTYIDNINYWRELLELFLPQIKPPGYDVYQFGVYSGNSIKQIIEVYDRCNIPIRKIFGFDSFEGIPEEKLDINNHKEWIKGFCNISKDLQLEPEIACTFIKQNLDKYHHNIQFIKGFWDEKFLTPQLIKDNDMRVATYIDIDCDIYSSAYSALDFMFKNKLVRSGTVIGYDDWSGVEEFTGGESKAHIDIEKKYNVEYYELFAFGANSQPPWAQKGFMVGSYDENICITHEEKLI
jgi:hypothetical protein